MVSALDPATTISLIVNGRNGPVSGLSRYSQALYQQLRQLGMRHVELVDTEPIPLPLPVIRMANRAGLGLDAFFKTYPVLWPVNAKGLIHLTQRSQATLLLHKGGRQVIVTVHDIIHYEHRHEPSMHIYRHQAQAWFDALAVRALGQADMIIASSRYTRQVLIDLLGIPADKISVIYLGIDHSLFMPRSVPDIFMERYNLCRDATYVLHISSEEPRKNLASLLTAFDKVRQSNPAARLLKIGRPLYPKARLEILRLIADLGLEEYVLFIDDVPDEDLPFFYSLAMVFAFPSRAEGFGFPVLEAMACGTPVVCSQATSLPELAGNAAVMVSPIEPMKLSEAINGLLSDGGLRDHYRKLGLVQAAKFTWEQTATQTAEIYARVLGGSYA